MTLRSQTQKIKLKFFGVIREIIVVMVAISKNTILLGILLMLMGMLLLIICTYIASIFGLISHPSPQTITILAIIVIAYIGVGACLIILTAIYTRKLLESSNKIIETTKIIKKDTDKEDLLKIQSVIIENLEESIDKKEVGSDGTPKR
jgi:hypothetical protein